MIDVIIPAYNSHDTIEDTLYSISYQNKSELLNVLIVNDDSDEDYSKIVKYFSNFLNIREIKLSNNSGPGVARQYGIDNSSSDFIVFIDSDDVFSSPFAIEILYEKITENNLDMVISNSLEETSNELIKQGNNTIWLHGKIYRRSFIKKYNILFTNSRSNEDNGFNQQMILFDAKTDYVDIVTYIWRNNKKSITRCNDYNFRYDSIFGYIYNINYALKKSIKENGNKYKTFDLAYNALIFIYFIYLEFYNKKNIKEVIKKSKKIYNVVKKLDFGEDRKLYLQELQYKSYYDEYTKKFLLNPVITFSDFLKSIEEVRQ